MVWSCVCLVSEVGCLRVCGLGFGGVGGGYTWVFFYVLCMAYVFCG